MANMSYCRIQNTLHDLRECADSLDEKLSHEEHRARRELICLMQDMMEELSIDVDPSDVADAIKMLDHTQNVD